MTNDPSNCTILVVDDEEAILSVVERMLMRRGYTVQTTSNGPDAIAMVKSGALPNLQVVLIDLSMPGMSGDQVVRELSSLLPEAGMILMSGYHPEQLIKRYPDLGFKGFLQKPFTRESLYTTVNDVIAALGEAPMRNRPAGDELIV